MWERGKFPFFFLLSSLAGLISPLLLPPDPTEKGGKANIVRTLTFFSLYEMSLDLFICHNACVNSVQLAKSPGWLANYGEGIFPLFWLV